VVRRAGDFGGGWATHPLTGSPVSRGTSVLPPYPGDGRCRLLGPNPRPSQTASVSTGYPGHGSGVTWRCPIGARPVPPHLGQTGGCLVSGSAGFATTITPVPRQAVHSSSSALCFGFFGCMALFGLWRGNRYQNDRWPARGESDITSLRRSSLFPQHSGNRATFIAIRLPSSFASTSPAAPRPRFAGVEVRERLPVGVPDDVAARHGVSAPGCGEAAWWFCHGGTNSRRPARSPRSGSLGRGTCRRLLSRRFFSLRCSSQTTIVGILHAPLGEWRRFEALADF
jgi:hypothetical protein